MSYPDLPIPVKEMLANEMVRTHHHLWHFVRNRQAWEDLPPGNRASLEEAGWRAPRFENEPGSGLDFLGMHRQMIVMSDAAMLDAQEPHWPRVTGWNPIPWDDDDPDWPVPAWQDDRPPWASDEQWARFTDFARDARSTESVNQMSQVADNLQNSDVLQPMILDELGRAMEWSIHGWMHLRWSGEPHVNGFSVDITNDWLFVPWSSHVNKHFWKLHGWIDERIDDWEAATGSTADLVDAWAGPAGVLPDMPHAADIQLLTHLPSRTSVPLPMQIKEHVVEGLLSP